MPNWVSNRLTIKGENAEEILNSVCEFDERSTERSLDFNKIVPMPESLNIVCGSLTNDCVALYLTSINPLVDYYGDNKMNPNEFYNLLKKVNAACSFSKITSQLTLDEVKRRIKRNENSSELKEIGYLQYGKNAVDNVLNYGHMSWYEWRLEHWGCKWNAGFCEVNGAEVTFETPWSPVAELILILSKKYPENVFQYDYAEEQAGYFAGSLLIQDGTIINGDHFSEYSKEAYEMYFDLRGKSPNYVFDEKIGTYVYTDGQSQSEM